MDGILAHPIPTSNRHNPQLARTSTRTLKWKTHAASTMPKLSLITSRKVSSRVPGLCNCLLAPWIESRLVEVPQVFTTGTDKWMAFEKHRKAIATIQQSDNQRLWSNCTLASGARQLVVQDALETTVRSCAWSCCRFQAFVGRASSISPWCTSPGSLPSQT